MHIKVSVLETARRRLPPSPLSIIGYHVNHAQQLTVVKLHEGLKLKGWLQNNNVLSTSV